MKPHDEILRTWETEGWITDWYAIDGYDPMTDTITRKFVGTYEDAVKMMHDYYGQPTDLAMQPFFRCSLINAQDARAYFETLADGSSTVVLDESPNYMSLTEAASALGVSRQRAHVLYKEGRISGRKIGSTLAIDRSSVERIMEGRGGGAL